MVDIHIGYRCREGLCHVMFQPIFPTFLSLFNSKFFMLACREGLEPRLVQCCMHDTYIQHIVLVYVHM